MVGDAARAQEGSPGISRPRDYMEKSAFAGEFLLASRIDLPKVCPIEQTASGRQCTNTFMRTMFPYINPPSEGSTRASRNSASAL
jgi:hypothetical protein